MRYIALWVERGDSGRCKPEVFQGLPLAQANDEWAASLRRHVGRRTWALNNSLRADSGSRLPIATFETFNMNIHRRLVAHHAMRSFATEASLVDMPPLHPLSEVTYMG